MNLSALREKALRRHEAAKNGAGMIFMGHREKEIWEEGIHVTDFASTHIPSLPSGAGPFQSKTTERQVGGDHYRAMKIQPAEFILANNLGWAEGCAIGYIARWRAKGGIQDLQKAIHTLQLLIDSESKP